MPKTEYYIRLMMNYIKQKRYLYDSSELVRIVSDLKKLGFNLRAFPFDPPLSIDTKKWIKSICIIPYCKKTFYSNPMEESFWRKSDYCYEHDYDNNILRHDTLLQDLLKDITQSDLLCLAMRKSNQLSKDICNIEMCNSKNVCIYCKDNSNPICEEHKIKMEWKENFWVCPEVIHIKGSCRSR